MKKINIHWNCYNAHTWAHTYAHAHTVLFTVQSPVFTSVSYFILKMQLFMLQIINY